MKKQNNVSYEEVASMLLKKINEIILHIQKTSRILIWIWAGALMLLLLFVIFKILINNYIIYDFPIIYLLPIYSFASGACTASMLHQCRELKMLCRMGNVYIRELARIQDWSPMRKQIIFNGINQESREITNNFFRVQGRINFFCVYSVVLVMLLIVSVAMIFFIS